MDSQQLRRLYEFEMPLDLADPKPTDVDGRFAFVPTMTEIRYQLVHAVLEMKQWKDQIKKVFQNVQCYIFIAYLHENTTIYHTIVTRTGCRIWMCGNAFMWAHDSPRTYRAHCRGRFEIIMYYCAR